jgi:hypothetical protein
MSSITTKRLFCPNAPWRTPKQQCDMVHCGAVLLVRIPCSPVIMVFQAGLSSPQ